MKVHLIFMSTLLILLSIGHDIPIHLDQDIKKNWQCLVPRRAMQSRH